jgi:hypothetical protein
MVQKLQEDLVVPWVPLANICLAWWNINDPIASTHSSPSPRTDSDSWRLYIKQKPTRASAFQEQSSTPHLGKKPINHLHKHHVNCKSLTRGLACRVEAEGAQPSVQLPGPNQELYERHSAVQTLELQGVSAMSLSLLPPASVALLSCCTCHSTLFLWCCYCYWNMR